MKLCEEELFWILKTSVVIAMPAYNIIKDAFAKRESFHPSKEILFVEKRLPWEHVFGIERELGLVGKIKFIIFESEKGMWRISTIGGNFRMRIPICKAWRGFSKAVLAKVSGI